MPKRLTVLDVNKLTDHERAILRAHGFDVRTSEDIARENAELQRQWETHQGVA